MLGPEPMPTTRVDGVVRVGRRPVGGGWIEFLPIDGTVGLLASAQLSEEGRFVADRVPLGRLGVRIVHPPFPLPCGRTFERVFAIRRTTRSQPRQGMTIDLVAEAGEHCPDGVPRP